MFLSLYCQEQFDPQLCKILSIYQLEQVIKSHNKVPMFSRSFCYHSSFTDLIWDRPHQMSMTSCMIYSKRGRNTLPGWLTKAHPIVKESYCTRKLVSLHFSSSVFLLPLESKSVDSLVLLILPPHILSVEGGSDHMWTLLPSLDAHIRSQNKGACGTLQMSVILVQNHYQSSEVISPGADHCNWHCTSYWWVSSVATAAAVDVQN